MPYVNTPVNSDPIGLYLLLNTKVPCFRDWSPAEFARQLGISKQAVNVWLKRGVIPEKRIAGIIALSDGTLTEEELRRFVA